MISGPYSDLKSKVIISSPDLRFGFISKMIGKDLRSGPEIIGHYLRSQIQIRNHRFGSEIIGQDLFIKEKQTDIVCSSSGNLCRIFCLLHLIGSIFLAVSCNLITKIY